MKKFKLYLLAILFATPILFTTSCKDKEEDSPWQKGDYDIWVSIGKDAGKANAETRIVKSVKSLESKENVDFKGAGVDVSAKLNQGSIIKDGYYYQIPKEKDRIGKYRIKDGKVEIVNEVMFKTNTLKDRRFSHAWIDDNKLVLFGADGESQKILWIKLNTTDMTISDEGILDIAAPSGKYEKLTTSGLASYRKSDNKIIYSYAYKTGKKMKGRSDHFLVAFINPNDMKIEKTIKEDRVEFMAGTAFGELLQNKTFFSDNGDYYIACNSVLPGAKSRTQQRGNLVRIKAGETEFDKSYLGFNGKDGKIVTVDYLPNNNNKVLLYIQDPKHTSSEWSSSGKASYNCYYAVLDLQTDKLEEIKLPFSQGTFAQRSIVKGNHAYIGINPEHTQPAVYMYDITTGETSKGITITEGYSFDRIVKLTD